MEIEQSTIFFSLPLSLHLSQVELVLWDTPGSEDHVQLTHIGLDKKDFVLLCFSLVDPKSMESVRTRVRKH